MSTAFKKLTRQPRLVSAWRRVKRNAESSQSLKTRTAAKEFDVNALSNIQSLQQRLIKKSFAFEPQVGLRIERPGKEFMPLVSADIEHRIVSRAVLETLQEYPATQRISEIPSSFGGIQSVADAIESIESTISAGAEWVIKTDIPDFFNTIPRDRVHNFVSDATRDPDFISIFDRATDIDLVNAAQLGPDIYRSPSGPTGLAQGSALSTLAGNIVLEEFDNQMNGRGISCFRYVDDFIILARTEEIADKAIGAAKKLLSRLGMTVYEPEKRPDKAFKGLVNRGFDFLGCRLSPGTVQPTRANRRNVLKKVQEKFDLGILSMKVAKNDLSSKLNRHAQTIVEVDNYVQGWAHSFAFCDGVDSFQHIDDEIDKKLEAFEYSSRQVMTGLSATERRHLSGIRSIRAIVNAASRQRTRKRTTQTSTSTSLNHPQHHRVGHGNEFVGSHPR